jgi:CRP-like cAMP-binding protein
MSPQLPEALQRRVDAFVADSGLPRAIVDELISHHTLVTYPKGSALFLQGSPADMFFWIFSGTVEVFCPQPGGERVLMRLCGPGEVLGHVDFIDHKQRRAQIFEAQARTKCEVALLTREHITRLLQALEPTQLIRLLEYVNTMWSAAANSWATFISLNYRKRLEIVLKDLASRFGVEDSRGTVLITDLLHAKLAEMIGSSRPMITRLINEMIEQGVLARRGKQYVLLNRREQPVENVLRHDNRSPRTHPVVFSARQASPQAATQPKCVNSTPHLAPAGRGPDRGLLGAAAPAVLTRGPLLKS